MMTNWHIFRLGNYLHPVTQAMQKFHAYPIYLLTKPNHNLLQQDLPRLENGVCPQFVWFFPNSFFWSFLVAHHGTEFFFLLIESVKKVKTKGIRRHRCFETFLCI